MASMTIAAMRTQARAIVDIDTTDISNTVLNNMLGQGFDSIVYSEKRWPFFERCNHLCYSRGTEGLHAYDDCRHRIGDTGFA
jgi:hypothetical protein